MDIQTFRLKPGQDLFQEIELFTINKAIEAGCIISAVGSLTQATLRLANRSTYNVYNGHFEIVSITGTISIHGSHIHISISDSDGVTLGGHLVPGCTIYTTAEIILASFPDIIYQRELCELSGYDELVIKPKNK